MPRLFTGLEIPSDIAVSLGFLRGGMPGARWIDVENYHLTLRFIGDIDERTADEIAHALDRIRRPAFSIRICGLDAFGGKKPHSVFARVEPNPGLAELQGEQERIMQRIGLPAEGRKFTPHVTIARTKGLSSSAIASWLAIRGDFSTPPFPVGRFVLFSSRASRGGGPYLVEEAYPLVA